MRLVPRDWERTERTGEVVLATIDDRPLTLVWRVYTTGKHRIEMFTAAFRWNGDTLACDYRERIRWNDEPRPRVTHERDVGELPLHDFVRAMHDGVALELTHDGGRWVGVFAPGMRSGAVHNTTVYDDRRYAFAFDVDARRCEVATTGRTDTT